VRVLFVHHDQYSGPDLVGERLADRGFEIVNHFVAVIEKPASDKPFPDPTGFDLVVPTGAVWSVYDRETIGSWINRELEFLRRAHEADVPMLGICFGAQSLAAALGGEVFRAPEREIGWCWVDSDVPDVVAPGPWFQWHEDTFSLPDGAEELARNGNGIQAYRIGRAFAVQFHPEVTAERVRQWIEVGGYRILTELGIDRDDLVAESRANEEPARRNGNRMIDWFLDAVARS
jgi:GMP synthase-like glutamine amidotransferase